MAISGDTCCSPMSLGSFRKFLIANLGSNTYVKSIRIGSNSVADFRSGYFVHANKQIENVCFQIASDPMLQNGYNAIGFSQGGQFLYDRLFVEFLPVFKEIYICIADGLLLKDVQSLV